MKILFLTVVPSPYQRDLFGALAARGDLDLKVCYLEAASPDSPWPEKALRPFERILPGFWLPFGGARWFFNWGLPNLADVEFVVLSCFTSNVAQRLMRGGLRAKHWLYWGERLRPQGKGLRGRLHARLIEPLAGATALVGIGRKAEEDYKKRFPNTRHFNVPYYCDLTEFQKSEVGSRKSAEVPFLSSNPTSDLRPPTSLPFIFLFAGQIIARKGVDLLLAAFDRLVAKGLDAELLLIGREADLPRFLKTISPTTRARIRYEGFQSPDELPQYFARADIFVLPSRHDGWGVVVNQALGAGLPIICSDAVGAAYDLIEPGVNGLVFPSENVDELTRCMERLARSPQLAVEWGAASRKKAADWSPESGAAKWSAVFHKLR